MQNGVSICTNERDIDVVYGLLNLRKEREEARSSLKYILTDVNDIRHSYIRLGFHLHEFDRFKFYEDFGYSSLAEFCEVNLGLSKSAVSRCISVFWEFSKKNDNLSQSRTMFLDDRYDSFSYSQLCEMVSMSDVQRRLVKPEMTIKQIRELKKYNVSRENENVSQVATSQRKEDFFDVSRYVSLHGAAESCYVKKAFSSRSVILEIHDVNGNRVPNLNNIWVDLMSVSSDRIVVRLRKEGAFYVKKVND